MHENTEKGIKIVGLLANAATVEGASFTKPQLNDLLELFNHQTANNDVYKEPGPLVASAINKFKDTETERNIKTAFPWISKIDLTLLEQ